MAASFVILRAVAAQVAGAEPVNSPGCGERPPCADGELARVYRERRDEAAFAQLVLRFGALVYGVALRVLRDHHAAEDVFQATFLVLARDAARIQRPDSIGAWLHGTALRIARSMLARRQREVHREVDMLVADEDSFLDRMSAEVEQQIVDDELQRLPTVYRAALVLHILEGRTCEETAAALGTSVGTVRGRLQRGKRELRLRLIRRGLDASAIIAAVAGWRSVVVAAVPPSLSAGAIQGGIALAEGATIPGHCSAEAVHLAARETTMFTAGKTVAASAILLSGAFAGWLAHAAFAGAGTAETPARLPVVAMPQEYLTAVDPHNTTADGTYSSVTMSLDGALAFANADEQKDTTGEASRATTLLKYGDGKPDGKKSIAGTGEMIRFTLPDQTQMLRNLRVHCSRYGTPRPPDEDAEITIVSEDGTDVIHTEFVPYSTFQRGESRWTTIRFEEPVNVPQTFWVILQFNAEQTKGVYVSYDTSTGGQYSKTGLPGGTMADVTFGGDWMVQAVLTKPE